MLLGPVLCVGSDVCVGEIGVAVMVTSSTQAVANTIAAARKARVQRRIGDDGIARWFQPAVSATDDRPELTSAGREGAQRFLARAMSLPSRSPSSTPLANKIR